MRSSPGQKRRMSASAPLADPCPHCGADVPPSARFCPSCGTGLAVQLEETPVTYRQAEPRWFGVAPPHMLLGLAAGLLVLSLVLFVTGHWPFGLILLGLGALLGAAFLETARRTPELAVVRTSVGARERAQSAVETWRARSAVALELRRIRNSLAQVEGERRGLLFELGAAAYGGDASAEASARTRLDELAEREAELHAELERAHDEAGERIRKARLPVQETMMVVPLEPTPPPDEGNPPTPAIVPEPYPPPDEGNPPTPAVVPEPGPGAPDDQ